MVCHMGHTYSPEGDVSIGIRSPEAKPGMAGPENHGLGVVKTTFGVGVLEH